MKKYLKTKFNIKSWEFDFWIKPYVRNVKYNFTPWFDKTQVVDDETYTMIVANLYELQLFFGTHISILIPEKDKKYV